MSSPMRSLTVQSPLTHLVGGDHCSCSSGHMSVGAFSGKMASAVLLDANAKVAPLDGSCLKYSNAQNKVDISEVIGKMASPVFFDANAKVAHLDGFCMKDSNSQNNIDIWEVISNTTSSAPFVANAEVPHSHGFFA
eukprot:11354217-Karenia_brevis.AAC.1